MPEGDSYTRAAEKIRPVLVGHAILAVDGSAPELRRRSGRLLDSVVTEVRTLGKHLLIDLSNDLTVHVHLGMPGRIGVGNRPPGPPGAVRAALTTSAGTVWVMAAPAVRVARRVEIDRELVHLGPDILAPEFDGDEFMRRASLYRDDRTVSDFLLDQRVMAGVGNVYKCEVLFTERLAPDRKMGTVSPERRLALAERARRLMLPNTGRGRRSTTGRRDETEWVYERAGRPCRRCRTAIVEGWIGDPPRVTYWCPTCQT